MSKLIRLTEKTYYLDAKTKIGFYRLDETNVCVIDSGIDDAAGKGILAVLDERGWNLDTLINTHGHADHVGGNRVLQKATGCRILARGIEADMARDTLVNPSLLWGGHPGADLHGRFFYAASSDVKDINFTPEYLPDGLQILPLPGHAADMIGLLTDDGVAFLGDALCDERVLIKNPFPFFYDPDAAFGTLAFLETLKADSFVPSHGEVLSDIRPLIELTREAIGEIKRRILGALDTPLCFEELLKVLLDAAGMRLDFPQYALIGSTVRSFLTSLRGEGKIVPLFEENRLLWKKS